MKKPIVLFFASMHCLCSAQNIELPKNRIPVHTSDSFIWVETYDGKTKSSSMKNDRTYFWIKAKQVHSSKGGYEGNLLHGEFTALYKNDALKEKGHFNKGLKTGEWKEWFASGEIKCISHWKNGLPHGCFFHYNEQGKIIQRNRYINGQLHGKQYTYTDSSETIARFRKGKAILPKPKKTKQPLSIRPATDIQPADSSSGIHVKTEKKRFHFKKEKSTKQDTGAQQQEPINTGTNNRPTSGKEKQETFTSKNKSSRKEKIKEPKTSVKE